MADEMTTKNCEELREALRDAKAQMRSPAYDDTVPGAFSAQIVAPRPDVTPDADPEVWEQINRIRRAMRDAGCSEEE